MVDLVARKYVKAILDGREIESVQTVLNELNQIAAAYSDEKFISIIASTEVTSAKKEELILSFVENCSEATANLVKLLSANKRLDIIGHIAAELSKEVGKLNNRYEGVIYTNNQLADDYVASLEEKFSAKLGVELKLVQNICDYDGIKVDVEDLGVEIGFSKDRLKTQMIEHILKAV